MLSDKERELISIGASIAAGCQPRTNFHSKAETTDYVPTLYKAMVTRPGYLEAKWRKVDVMAVEPEERPDDD